MFDQSQQTCSICGKVFHGVIKEIHPGVQTVESKLFYSNNQLTGRQCTHCGADVCNSCDPKVGFLANLLGSKKNTCPKCGHPEWSVKSYFIYSGAADVKNLSEWLGSYLPDAWNQKDEMLALLEKCSDQIVELVFNKAVQRNEGDELLKLARMAKVGWLDPFRDMKIEERLLEVALNHESDNVKYNACVTLIQLEEILRSNRAIPVLLRNLESEEITFYNIYMYIIKALASSLPALGGRHDVIDICVEALQSDINYWDRRLLAEKLLTAVGNDETINEKIIGGLALALKQRANGPLKEGSLVSHEISIGGAAAESLGSLGSLGMHAVPALIQALREGGLGVLISGWNVWTDALCSITGMNFANSADEWQAWWENNH